MTKQIQNYKPLDVYALYMAAHLAVRI